MGMSNKKQVEHEKDQRLRFSRTPCTGCGDATSRDFCYWCVNEPDQGDEHERLHASRLLSDRMTPVERAKLQSQLEARANWIIRARAWRAAANSPTVTQEQAANEKRG